MRDSKAEQQYSVDCFLLYATMILIVQTSFVPQVCQGSSNRRNWRGIAIRKNGHTLLEGNTPRPSELSSYGSWDEEIKKLGISGTIGHFDVDTY